MKFIKIDRMSTFERPKRYLSCLWTYFFLLCLLSMCVAVTIPSNQGSTSSLTDFCEQWKTYKDPLTGLCLPCSHCPQDHVTVVLCEFDRDTLCRPSTDLATHIQTVVHSGVVVLAVEEDVMNGSDYTSALVVALVATISSGVVVGAFYLIRKYRNQVDSKPKDPLQLGLLDDQDDESEKPTLDMDELLAQRYGRSLVTNHYVP